MAAQPLRAGEDGRPFKEAELFGGEVAPVAGEAFRDVDEGGRRAGGAVGGEGVGLLVDEAGGVGAPAQAVGLGDEDFGDVAVDRGGLGGGAGAEGEGRRFVWLAGAKEFAVAYDLPDIGAGMSVPQIGARRVRRNEADSGASAVVADDIPAAGIRRGGEIGWRCIVDADGRKRREVGVTGGAVGEFEFGEGASSFLKR